MEIAEHLAALREQGELLAAAAERVDHAATVPGAPAWQVADLVRHVGLVHRWAADAVREGRQDASVYGSDDGSEFSGAALVGWFRTGHRALVETLAGADPAVRCFTFLPAPSPLAFWARRQTHETGIHRADVESARGPVLPFPVPLALDGLDEIIGGFAARASSTWAEPERTLGLLPTDAPGDGWLVHVGAAGSRPVRSAAAAAAAECVLRGTASELYLLLWNRAVPADMTGGVTGDEAVLAAWRRRVRVRWGGPGPRRPRSVGPAPAAG
ncbi:MAG: maleylpyruvate isomerase family mycothiol-dependent enzyme [Mycobacteriales bacterium]